MRRGRPGFICARPSGAAVRFGSAHADVVQQPGIHPVEFLEGGLRLADHAAFGGCRGELLNDLMHIARAV
jgi:hypothetical protein